MCPAIIATSCTVFQGKSGEAAARAGNDGGRIQKPSETKQKDIRDLFMRLYEKAPLYEILHNGELVVAHAGIKAEDIGKSLSEK